MAGIRAIRRTTRVSRVTGLNDDVRWRYVARPYCFIFRQSVTVLIFSASGASVLFPRKCSSARSSITRSCSCRSKLSFDACCCGFCEISGGSSRGLMVSPRATMTARSIACSSSRTLPERTRRSPIEGNRNESTTRDRWFIPQPGGAAGAVVAKASCSVQVVRAKHLLHTTESAA
jgi:hypothetical protein